MKQINKPEHYQPFVQVIFASNRAGRNHNTKPSSRSYKILERLSDN